VIRGLGGGDFCSGNIFVRHKITRSWPCEFYLSFHFDGNGVWRCVKVAIEVDLKVHVRSFWQLEFLLSLWTEYCLCVKFFKHGEDSKFRADSQNVWGTRWLLTRRSRVRFPMVSMEIFNRHNPSSRTMALESIHPLTVMIIRNIS